MNDDTIQAGLSAAAQNAGSSANPRVQDPIDAEYTPVRPRSTEPDRRGPSWAGLVTACLLTMILSVGVSIGVNSLGVIPGSHMDQALNDLRNRTQTSETNFRQMQERLLGQSNSALALRQDVDKLTRLLQNLDAAQKLNHEQIAGIEAVGANPEGATYFEMARTLASLRARMGALEVAALRQGPDPASAAGVQIASNDPSSDARLVNIEAQLRAQEAVLGGVRGPLVSQGDLAAAQEELAHLNQRLVAFETGPAGPKRAAALYLVSALEEVGDSGRPFEPEFLKLTEVLKRDSDVDALAMIARNGAKSFMDIKMSFPKAEKAVRKAWNKERPSKGFFGWWNSFLANFVTIRRIEPGAAETPTDILGRASNRLEHDDLQGAIAEMVRLKGQSALAAQAWLKDARSRAEFAFRVEALRRKLALDVVALSQPSPT